MTLGNYAADLPDQATGAEKAAYMAEAKAAYRRAGEGSGHQVRRCRANGSGTHRHDERRHDAPSRARTPTSSRIPARFRTRR